MSNLSPHANSFDPATWCLEPRTPTPEFSPLQTLSDPAHRPLSYANVAKPNMPEPFPAYESPSQHPQVDFHGHQMEHSQASLQGQPYDQAGRQAQPCRSPLWTTPSRFNLHTHGDQSGPVGEYGIALDAPLPPFGQGKWVNGGPDRQEMAPIGFEMRRWTSNMGNLTMRVRRKMWGEQERELSSIGSSTNGSASAGASTSSVHDKSTNSSPTTSLSTAGSSNITTPGSPFKATHPATPVSLYFAPTTSTETCPDGVHIQANEYDEAQAKGKALENGYAEFVSTLSNGTPVVNMQQLKGRFEVPDTVDESAYNSLSDFADQSVLNGNLTLIEGHIIARQLFHARCKYASAFAVDAATKASAEVVACAAAGNTAAEAGIVKASVDAATSPAASSSGSSWVCTKAYIPSVSSRIGADALKATLTAFGQVTYFDINRQKRCAFVEFATTAQFLAAHNANPHMVGEETIRVEVRRVKNGPYGLRPGNFAGRGGMNNRGRGGFDALKDGFRDFSR